MGPEDVRTRLREYGEQIRALLADVERDVQRGVALTPPVRSRLQAFAERLNGDLLELYDRQRRPGLTELEAAYLLPVVARLRDLVRGLGALRDADAALHRLRSAATAAAGRAPAATETGVTKRG
jgi:hypothetical protein